MHVAGRLIRQARRSARLSQQDLADLVGLHQPGIAAIESSGHDTRVERLERILASVQQRIISIPTTSPCAAEVADALFEICRAASTDRVRENKALRVLFGFSDRLAEADPATRVALCVTPAAPCGDPRFDATLAGIVDHHLRRDRLPVPAWVDSRDLVLDEPWAPSRYIDTDTAKIPAAFRRRNVLLAATELASV